MSKIGVFPASGGLGTSTYRPLLKFVSPADVVLISRHPERTDPEYLKTGVETRKADYDVPDTLEHVFDNISCLYLVSYPSIRHHHRVKVAFFCPTHIIRVC